MSLSYSGLTNYGVVTLPSVESWGTNMNIIRDPPKAIFTRRIDRVGQTSSITETIDDSSNRASEAIQVYARGVNPCVSVSYSNYGNNGGQGNSGHLTGIGVYGRQAKLPYTVMKDGAFRPPVLRQEQIMPLSRQPRVWTTALTQPGFTDFSRKLQNYCGDKDIKKNTIKTDIRPTAVYQIEKPIEPTYDVKNHIQHTIINPISSGMRTRDLTQQNVLEPTKEVSQNPLHANAHTNINDSQKYIINNTFDSKRYIQDMTTHMVNSNGSSKISAHTAIDDILDLSNLPIKDIKTFSAFAPYSREGDGTKYIHDDIQLDRNLPEYTTSTNMGDKNVYKYIAHENELEFERNIPVGNFETSHVQKGNGDHGSRTAHLIPKISAGGFAGNSQMPAQHRIQQEIPSYESEKTRMSRNVLNSIQGRFDKPAPFK